jgi:hypothetical protein
MPFPYLRPLAGVLSLLAEAARRSAALLLPKAPSPFVARWLSERQAERASAWWPDGRAPDSAAARRGVLAGLRRAAVPRAGAGRKPRHPGRPRRPSPGATCRCCRRRHGPGRRGR